MDNHTQRTIPHPKKKKSIPPQQQKIIAIVVAAIVALALIVTGIIVGVKHKNKDKYVEHTPIETQNQLTETQAQTTTIPETTTETESVKLPGIMFAAASTLNVREKPTTDSKVVAKYARGNEVKVLEKHNDEWYKVDANGVIGYCSAKYLATSKPEETTAGEAETKKEQNTAPYMLAVNRKQNIVIVYEKDGEGNYTVPKKAMICSVGLDGKTPTGTFKTTDKYTWRALSGGVYGQYATRITGHYLFHSVPYFTQSKSDLEYEEFNKLGEPASLGCVRLSVADAKWIYDNCPAGTPVKIYDSDAQEPLARPTAPKIDVNNKANRGWDPTDPDSKNPWH